MNNTLMPDSIRIAPIALWPALTPGPGVDAETVDTGGLVRNVSVPQAVPFLPPPHLANGTAIIICPGGAYALLDWVSHVERLAARFNPLGIAVIGVRYRTTPPSVHVPGAALEDLRRAIRVAHANATAWQISPERLVGLGFSAGSNLLLNHASTRDDLLDTDALHRGAATLGYMALLCLWPHGKPVSAYAIRPNAPRTLLCVSEEDTTAPVAFSHGIAAAIRVAGQDAEVKVYATGDHLAFNFGEDGPVTDWTPAFLAWLKRNALL